MNKGTASVAVPGSAPASLKRPDVRGDPADALTHATGRLHAGPAEVHPAHARLVLVGAAGPPPRVAHVSYPVCASPSTRHSSSVGTCLRSPG